MDDISILLKEAKPMYFERKRKVEQLKKACLVLFVLFSTSISGLSGYIFKTNQMANTLPVEQVASYYNDIDDEMSESMYPLDDYGLITVKYWEK